MHYLDTDGVAEIIYSKGERVCALSCGDGFVSALPTHPRASGRFSPILTHEMAGHVLTRVEPAFEESDADIFVARGYAAGGASPVVTAVWFRVDVTRPRIDLRRALARLRGRTVAHAREACGEKGFGDVQTASGVYIEYGLGVLPGRGRHSISIRGKAHSVPYHRAGACTTEDEGLLSELMCGVASVVGRVDASMVSNRHALLLERGHQYPRQHLDGDSFIKSHQVVVRASGGPNDPEGSDLHIDSMDGRVEMRAGHGLCTLEATRRLRSDGSLCLPVPPVALALTCLWTASVAIGHVQYMWTPATDFMAAYGLLRPSRPAVVLGLASGTACVSSLSHCGASSSWRRAFTRRQRRSTWRLRRAPRLCGGVCSDCGAVCSCVA